VAANAYRIRVAKGWTQQQVAERVDWDDAEYRRYELGRASFKLETLVRLALALRVEPWELMKPVVGAPRKRRPGRPARPTVARAGR
jgi:transcriptional regulator with XRE-family HTH domain